MKKQAAEAKPETKDIKAEEQKPKVPAPQWAGVGEPFRENLETSDPGLSNHSSFTSVNDGSKSALRLLNPIPLPLPTLNLGPTCTSGRSRDAPARTLTQLLNPAQPTLSTLVPTRS